jgi:hypothetical protein
MCSLMTNSDSDDLVFNVTDTNYAVVSDGKTHSGLLQISSRMLNITVERSEDNVLDSFI